MNKRILYISLGIVGAAAVGYLFFLNEKRKAENEVLQKSLKDISEKYKIFN